MEGTPSRTIDSSSIHPFQKVHLPLSQHPPYPKQHAVIGIGTYIVLSLITCGLYSLVWQYRQIEVVNAWLGRKDFDFWIWLILSFISCGLYALYTEYTMAKALNEVQRENGHYVNEDLALLSVVLALFGAWVCLLYTSPSPRD